MQRNPRILWADDEIDLLKPHVLFLEGKGYHVTAVNSGVEALEKLGAEVFDLVFLDEQMPGLNGLDTLQRIKEQRPYHGRGDWLENQRLFDQAGQPESDLACDQEEFGRAAIGKRKGPVGLSAGVSGDFYAIDGSIGRR
jgi:CheY-like chemotaxis protein